MLGVQVGADFEPGGRGGATDQAEDLVIVGERLSGPVPADLAEQAAFYRVVLGGAGGIVGHSNGEPQPVAEMLLELVFPGAAGGGITATGIGQNQQVLGVWVATVPLPRPPCGDGGDRESGGSWLTPTNTEPRLAWGS